MVPKNWRYINFGSVAEFKNGLNFTKVDDGELIKIVGVSDFKNFNELKNTNGLNSVRVATVIKDSELLKDGDLLFVRSNGNKELIGRCLFFPKVMERLAYSGFTIRGRITSKDLTPKYAAVIVRSSLIKNQFLKFGGGTNISNLSQQILSDVMFGLPSLPEQTKIAKILSTWDKAIEIVEKLIENSKQQKKSLMQQLLMGKKRFKEFGGVVKRYHFSNILKIDQNNLGRNTSSNYSFSYISLSDVNTGKISSKLENHIYKNAPSRARRVVNNGDILLSTVRPNLKGFAQIRFEHDGCIASTGFAVLTPNNGMCSDYIFHYLFSAHISGQINALVVGSNYPAINSSDVAGLSIYCPNYDEQIKIAKVLNKCDQTVNTLRSKLEYMQQEKKSLMQQLLTGKRGVKIDTSKQETTAA